MRFNTEDVVKNLSSKKLWTIIESHSQTMEEKLIADAKLELQRRNHFSDTEKYSAPH